MKNFIQHGKIWLIAAGISLGALTYMQLDSQNIEKRQEQHLATQQDKENLNDADVKFIEFDLIKDITQVVIAFLRM